jgi:superfamily II DNA/RNA helicase
MLKTFESFNELDLPGPLGNALVEMGFLNPTPVQEATIPLALLGKDVLGTAQTGTGKTGAFGIPLLTFLDRSPKHRALVLAPTRELAAQIHSVLQKMGKGMGFYGTLLVGGESFHRQANELQNGTDYIIATPGRLIDHMQQRTINLASVGLLVLDEVDRMLDMGFIPQIRQIMTQVPKERQTLLFSATLPAEIASLAASFLKSPERVSIGAVANSTAQVEETTIRLQGDAKNTTILKELKARQGKVLVFARTQARTDRLAKMLYREGMGVVALHGGKTQGQRKLALERFRNGSSRILVATDLAGRGIDVLDIEHVINYDVPGSREDYVHRIGRTGRNGKTGQALNLLENGDVDGEEAITGVRRKQYRPAASTGRRPSAPRGRRRW